MADEGLDDGDADVLIERPDLDGVVDAPRNDEGALVDGPGLYREDLALVDAVAYLVFVFAESEVDDAVLS